MEIDDGMQGSAGESVDVDFNNKMVNNYKLRMNPKVQQSVEDQLSEEEWASEKNEFLQEKFEQIIEKHPDLSADQAFYLEYCKLYIETIKVQSQVQETVFEIQKLSAIANKNAAKVKKNISQHLQNDTSYEERQKRIRRTANQIARHYVCKVEKCQKSYGSQGSLNQHMKIKHKQLYESMIGLDPDK